MVDVMVCRDGEMIEGDVRIVSNGRVEAGVFRHDGAYHACRNLCPHQGGPACEGLQLPRVLAVIDHEHKFHGQTYDEGELHFVCPWHGYEFKMKTGECAGDPQIRLHRYPATERDGNVYVAI